jgi:hypothetical protein
MSCGVQCPNLDLLHGDILTIDIAELIGALQSGRKPNLKYAPCCSCNMCLGRPSDVNSYTHAHVACTQTHVFHANAVKSVASIWFRFHFRTSCCWLCTGSPPLHMVTCAVKHTRPSWQMQCRHCILWSSLQYITSVHHFSTSHQCITSVHHISASLQHITSYNLLQLSSACS